MTEREFNELCLEIAMEKIAFAHSLRQKHPTLPEAFIALAVESYDLGWKCAMGAIIRNALK